MSSDYSTHSISPALLKEISETISGLDYGSIEIYVANEEVVQITKRQIKKTNGRK